MVLERLRTLFADEPSRLRPTVFDLRESEKWWRDRFSLLESHGYRLRERLRPGWIPSWKTNPSLHPEDCEDSTYNYNSRVTPAVRTLDGSHVIIKRVSKSSDEKSIAVYLSSFQDKNNNSVPIIDTFTDEVDDNVEFIVMPLLRRFDSPPFYRVDEVIDFIQQTLQGIAFIHGKDVAHRDCSGPNIMLDGTPLYPRGFHPIRMDLSSTQTTMAEYRNRSDVKGVKYYFTDFGISTRFDSSDEGRLVTGCKCQVDVPELSDYIPYDPFAVDIYLLGDVYKRNFIEKFANVQFLGPLVESMVRQEPSQRPDASKALKMLDELLTSQPVYGLRWRLIDIELGRVPRLILNIKCAASEGGLVLLKLIDICTLKSASYRYFFEPFQTSDIAVYMVDILSLSQILIAIPQIIDYSVKSVRILREYKKINGDLRFSFERAEYLMYELRKYVIIVQCTALSDYDRVHLEKALRRAHCYMTKLDSKLKVWISRLQLNPNDACEGEGPADVEHDAKSADVIAGPESTSTTLVRNKSSSKLRVCCALSSALLSLNKMRYLALGAISIREASYKLEVTNKVLEKFLPISNHLDHLLSYDEAVIQFTRRVKSMAGPQTCRIPRNLKVKELEENDDPIFFRVTEDGEYKGCIVERRFVNELNRAGEEKRAFVETERLATMLREDKQVPDDITAQRIGILKCCGYMVPNADTHELVFRKPDGYAVRTLRKLLTTPGTEVSSFEDRIDFAIKLATAVHVFHTIGFVHKSIKPETILVMEPPRLAHEYFYTLGMPYLAGFCVARYDESASGMYCFDKAMNARLYHDPRQLASNRSQKYQIRDDIYSLGVCLLEIGLWRSFFRWDVERKIYVVDKWAEDLFADLPIDEDGDFVRDGLDDDLAKCENEALADMLTKKKLIQMARTQLNTKVNSAFCEAVVTCLKFGDEDNLLSCQAGSYSGSAKFYSKVICELRRAKGIK